MNNKKYSIVVPVYKSSLSLIELSERVDTVFSSLNNASYELIFVNDSPFFKQTVKALETVHEQNSNVIVIELMKNFGQQPATLCGIEHASGDFIITMDDDLQHAPEDIPKLIESSEHDVVMAKFTEKKHSFFKRFTSDIKGYFDRIILGKPKHIKLSPFRLIKAQVVNMMFATKTPYPFIPALLFSATDDIVNVQLHHHERFDGVSHYTFLKMLKLFSNLMINNSSFLLRMIGYIGVLVSFGSFIFAAFIIIKKIFFGYAFEGWASIMVAILFLGGLIMFSIGLIGEYLVRIIGTSENRPVYFIRKTCQKNGNE